MSNDRLANVEATLIAQLGTVALSTDELERKIKSVDPTVGANEVRYALWHLVSDGKLDFDPKWHVIPTNPAA
jgi:hypothetical protein